MQQPISTGSIAPLVPRSGTPTYIVRNCRDSIVAAAAPLGAVRVDAASAGQTQQAQDGRLVAPIEVRIVYASTRARQVRHSYITCQISADGTVTALDS
ncbi:hypothetical protein [Microvirga roseola]|uniref:hypothetical protein n=1 Tax=Microvirga roseola TaxID=2883126 RepID=UPI001E2C803A|nr:hypothetical protein [Microvirga roseola]